MVDEVTETGAAQVVAVESSAVTHVRYRAKATKVDAPHFVRLRGTIEEADDPSVVGWLAGGRFGDRRRVVGPGRKKSLMRVVMLIVAAVLIVIGAVWALRGLGVMDGTAMSGNSMWAFIGPILVVVGLTVGLVAFRRGARRG